jgi:hypothetical protein
VFAPYLNQTSGNQMRKIILTVFVFSITLAGLISLLPARTYLVEGATCPIELQPNRTIIYFNSFLRADEELDKAQSSWVNTNLPAGNYEVTLVSFDDHTNKPGQIQPNEAWYVVLLGENGAPTITTPQIRDVADEEEMIVETVDFNFSIPNDVRQVSALHAVYPNTNPNSVTAVCASFDLLPENTPPVIALLGDNPLVLTVGDAFTDPGATAFDEEDGDISGQIVVGGDAVDTDNPGTYIVTYNVEDSKGALAEEVTREVVVESPPSPECSDGADNDNDGLTDAADPACHTDSDANNPDSYDSSEDDENSKPIIMLVGSNPMAINPGDAFTDPGATAFDEEDGDITENIVVTGVVDNNTIGVYTLTYNVEDSRGKAASEVARTVEVEELCIDCGAPGPVGGGPTFTPLIITDEAVEAAGTSTVRITWNTNIPATSRVVFGTDSVPVLPLGSNPNLGYATSTAIVASTTVEHVVTITDLEGQKTYYFRPASKRANKSNERRTVGKELSITLGSLPVATSTEESLESSSEAMCGAYLLEFIKFGEANNPEEVKKLQIFLRDFEDFSDLLVTGVYDEETRQAVEVFQQRYRENILEPWGLEDSTGYVYITTKKKINEIYCQNQEEFPLTADERREIEEYRALVESLRVKAGVTDVDIGDLMEEIGGPVGGAWGTTGQDVAPSQGEEEKKVAGGGDGGSNGGNSAATAVIEAFDSLTGKQPFSSLSGEVEEGGEEATPASVIDIGAIEDGGELAVLDGNKQKIATSGGATSSKNLLSALIIGLPRKFNMRALEFFSILTLLVLMLCGVVLTISTVIQQEKRGGALKSALRRIKDIFTKNQSKQDTIRFL